MTAYFSVFCVVETDPTGIVPGEGALSLRAALPISGLLTCSSIAALRLSSERAPRKLAHHFSGEPVYASRCRCGAIVVQCNSRCLNPSRNVDPDFHRDPLRRTARDVGAREPSRAAPFRTQPALTPMRDSRVAHRLRPTDPSRLASWKSLHHLRTRF
jgi:hypothetical protein